MSNSRGDNWYTPHWLVNALGSFDLDPAAPTTSHWTARACYTKAEDGLALPWQGRVFLNPPYSAIAPWIERMTEHRNGIALVFARMDTVWMHRALDDADAIFFIKGRISFVDSAGKKAGSAPAPSVLLAYGNQNVAAIKKAAAAGLINGKLFKETPFLLAQPKLITGADPEFGRLAAD